MRYARESAGFTRKELADESKVTDEIIMLWETKGTNATLNFVSFVAGALGITIQEYVSGTTPTDTDDMPDLDSMGEYMWAARKAKGMSQQDLADSTGLCSMSICRYETDRTVPRLEHAIKIADVLGVSLDRLVGFKIN